MSVYTLNVGVTKLSSIEQHGLSYQEFGTGEPLLILHGLFGAGDNWLAIAKQLASHFRVILPDLPNHGHSFFVPTMTYASLSQAVVALLDNLGIDQAKVIGHSMGGKVGMALALLYPERVSQLVVADILPKEYPDKHGAIFDALMQVDPPFESVTFVDKALESLIPNVVLRRFLLKSLKRSSHGYEWKLNLPVLYRFYPDICSFLMPPEYPSDVPTLFLYGGQSDYVSNSGADMDQVSFYFNNARFQRVEHAGHWLHVDQPEAMLDGLLSFLVP